MVGSNGNMDVFYFGIINVVCGAFCLNSEILEKIFRGFGYSGSLYFLFILMIDLNKLRESI